MRYLVKFHENVQIMVSGRNNTLIGDLELKDELVDTGF